MSECPFANLPEKHAGRWGQGLTAEKMAECRWLKPVLVGQFEFVEWTPDHHLRHAKFVSLRDDKKPSEVRREETRADNCLWIRVDDHGAAKPCPRTAASSKGWIRMNYNRAIFESGDKAIATIRCMQDNRGHISAGSDGFARCARTTIASLT